MKLFEKFANMNPSDLFNSFFRMLNRKVSDEGLKDLNEKIREISLCTFEFDDCREVYDENDKRIGKIYNIVVKKEEEYFFKSKEESTIEDVFLLFPDEDGYFYFLGRQMYSPFVVFDKFSNAYENNEDDENESESEKYLDLENSIVLQGYYLGVASALLQILYDKIVHGNSKLTNIIINSLARKLGVTYNVFFASKKSEKGVITYAAQKIPLFFLPDGLNEVERLSCPRKVVYPNEKVADTVRYPHKSHLGIVDLLETPESEKIGLTLTLVDSDDLDYDFENLRIFNKRIKSGESINEDMLSLATKQIPFIPHSDGARILMGSKNLKQAIKVDQAEKPILSTGFEKENIGVNALVAYGLFYGFNFEDGIVVSESFAKKMSSKVIEEEKYTVSDIPSTKEPRLEQNEWIYEGDMGKRVRIIWKVVEGETVSFGKTLYEVWRDGGKKYEQKYEGRYEAEIISLQKEPALPFQTHLGNDVQIEIWIKYKVYKPLELGDKLMGRYGNKGTISLIVPDNQMPEVEINGSRKSIDVMLSPMGVVSRMNLGQLYETHITMAQVHAGFDDLRKVSPLENVYVHKDRLLEKLMSIGADEYGRFKVFYKNYEWRLVVGYQYLYRLDHCVRDKIHVVSIANESKLTNQPMKGRARFGGQRFGELEFWSIYSYSNRNIVKLFARKNLSDEILSKNKDLDSYPEDLAKEIFRRLFSLEIDTSDYMISKFYFTDKAINHEKDMIDEYISMAFKKLKRHGRKIQFLKLWLIFNQSKYKNEYEQFARELSLALEDITYKEDFVEKISVLQQKLDELEKKYKSIWNILKKAGIDLKDFVDKVKSDITGDEKIKDSSLKVKESKLRKFISELFAVNEDSPELLKILNQFLMQKEGYLRDQVIARRLHYSGRTVISPMPLTRLEEYDVDLDIDTCVLPVDFGIEWFEKKLEEYNINRHKVYSALRGDYEVRKEIARILNKVVEKEDIYVLVNRQPSIHRHSVQGFKPVFWHNYTIGLPINVCEGFNADFDGDTMAVYYPVEQTEEIKNEIRKMLPSRNPFKLGNGELIYSIDQDMVYGYYVKNECRSAFDKKKLKEEAGQKIRHYALREDYDSIKNYIRKEIIGELIEKSMEKNLTLSIYEIDRDEGSMKFIKESKCRGNSEQYRQLNEEIDIRNERKIKGGFVKGVPIEDYFNPENGIVKRARSTLMDKKLKVAEAGYFTRKLVEFLGCIRIKKDLYEYLEHEIDLSKEGMKEFGRSRFLYRWIKYDNTIKFVEKTSDVPEKFTVLSPKILENDEGLFVSAKYCGKDISTLKDFVEGEYIGISAGHVIGERGTQLSMQTFHTGGKGLQMNSVSNSVFKSAFESESYQQFIERIEEEFRKSMGESLLKRLDSNSIYFELIYNFAQYLKQKNISSVREYFEDYKMRGPLTCMTFERGISILKKIEILDKDSKEHSDGFRETHPRVEYSFYWRCMQ